MKKILVTGGSGFIGANLISRLSQMEQYEITLYDIAPPRFMELPQRVRFIQGDLRDSNLLRKIIIDHSIELIYHLAWGTIHETATRDPLEDVNVNVHSSLTLFDACVHSKVERIIYASSGGTVYGVPQQLPIIESHATNPINAYGISKLTVEKYLQMYAYLYSIEYTIFRPSVPFGPFQNPNRRQGAVTVFTYNALTGKPIHIWGDGNIVRDYFYIDDLIEALTAALFSDSCRNRILNLSGPHAVSLNELIETIAKTLNRTPTVHYEKGRKIDVETLTLDSSAAKHHLNWTANVDLEEGVRRTADWMKNDFIPFD
ncbi:MAG: NAD-dependent epimerase/dehydratase family protein [candidate division KSB1 bacterium]|nr:NAD-dependent epimerase/dehydratase family protein [candidate division KSB1 bacterium]